MFPADGCVTARAKPVATAASTALPPFLRISRPTSEEIGSTETTSPFSNDSEVAPSSVDMITSGEAQEISDMLSKETGRKLYQQDKKCLVIVRFPRLQASTLSCSRTSLTWK